MSDSLQPMDYGLPGSSVHGIVQVRYWSSSLSLLQGIFPTQGSNPDLLHCRQILYCLRCYMYMHIHTYLYLLSIWRDERLEKQMDFKHYPDL